MAIKERYHLGEACQMLGVSKSTYLRYEKNTVLPKAKRDGRGWRYFLKVDMGRNKDILKKKNFI